MSYVYIMGMESDAVWGCAGKRAFLCASIIDTIGKNDNDATGLLKASIEII